jgi:predicted ArsR family transcriptional regulator
VGERWNAVAALVDRSRRALYDYVRRAGHPVSREEAADAQGISRNLAAFHLDKLVDVGLLQARYEPPPGRPRGRGRAPKVYQPVGDEVAVSVPERRYELIAVILADAVAEDPHQAGQAAQRHAYRQGREVGARARQAGATIGAALSGLGFEPESADDRIVLGNCPFQALARRQTALVCGLNHAFVGGVVDGLGRTDRRARLEPRPGRCCVEIVPAGRPATPA